MIAGLSGTGDGSGAGGGSGTGVASGGRGCGGGRGSDAAGCSGISSGWTSAGKGEAGSSAAFVSAAGCCGASKTNSMTGGSGSGVGDVRGIKTTARAAAACRVKEAPNASFARVDIARRDAALSGMRRPSRRCEAMDAVMRTMASTCGHVSVARFSDLGHGFQSCSATPTTMTCATMRSPASAATARPVRFIVSVSMMTVSTAARITGQIHVHHCLRPRFAIRNRMHRAVVARLSS